LGSDYAACFTALFEERSLRCNAIPRCCPLIHAGVEYLNAAAQCEQAQAAVVSHRKLSRDTQTYVRKNVAVQSKREAATQMARSDLLLEGSRDKVVVSRNYEDSEHWERRRDHAVVTLQRHWRGWLARRRAAELRKREDEKQEVSIFRVKTHSDQ
jgi:hypothetical protein